MPDLLNYKISGKGQPLVILHGLFGSLDNWVSLAKRFSDDYKVVLVDQRNHGKSFHDAAFDYEVMSDDLDQLMSTLDLEDPILIGHSMGGKTVMQYCAFNPDKVDKLIAADIGPKKYPVHHDQIIHGLKQIDVTTLSKREQAEDMLSHHVSDLGVRSFLLKNLKRTQDGGLEWKMNLDGISESIANVGAALDYYLPIEIPTLFLRGSKSDYILDEDQPQIQEIFPESFLQTIPDAGHWIHAEQPDLFYKAVMKFLKN